MRRSIASSATIAALALTVPCTATSQVLSGAAGGVGFDLAPNCSNPVGTVVAPVGQTICTAFGAYGEGDWDASFGALHVFAEVDAKNALPPVQYLTMSALGRLDDPLIFTGVRPSTVVVSLQETWTQSSAYLGLGPNAFTSEMTVGGAYFCTNDYLASYAAGSFAQGRSVSCEIPSTGALTLSYQISAFATIANPAYPTLAPFSGTAITDASHTGTITALTFFDAAGNDITSSVTYTTGSGARYQGAPVATVPEPAPGLMVATGMIAVGVAVTRRRRSPPSRGAAVRRSSGDASERRGAMLRVGHPQPSAPSLMRRLLPALPALLLAAPAAAQARAEYYSAATLERTADSLRTAKAVAKVLGDRGSYQYVLVTRDATGGPEMHARWTDVMLVQAGSATVLLGGQYQGGHEETPGETRGGQLVGANAQRVAAGDLIVIPAGMPHQVQLAPGASIRYVTVKAPEH